MNIHYQSESIARFYAEHRVRWEHIYPSEQLVFERVFRDHGAVGTVLDAGCACGGLGRALHERFGISHYTGVDINQGAIDWARREQGNFPAPSRFECADIAAKGGPLEGAKFDLVVSLGCADWNCDTRQIIQACWDHTAEGGYFVLSFRLTNERTIDGIETGYQWVKFDATEITGNEEKAPYVVTNVNEMLRMVHGFTPRPRRLLGYGYWGQPSAMAVIPYEKVVFSVLAVQKKGDPAVTETELLLPLDVFVPPAKREPGEQDRP